ncbi:MAG: hypothetical protein ACOC3D_12005 [Pseudomonadota bacterium]
MIVQVTCKTEQSLFDHETFELVRQTHYPAILALEPEALAELRGRLRQLRDKERTLARQRQREARGKAGPRGGSFPGTAEDTQRRKTALTAALRRLHKEAGRQAAVASRTANAEAARRALALRRAAEFAHHPAAGDHAIEEVRSMPSRRRRHTVLGSRIGRVSQHTKVRQAIRDARN